jgi:cytochrome d ubiquinol oxidase subunit I
MDVEILARIQFAFTIAFHYIYPPLSIGIGLIMVIMESLYLKTGKKEYEILTRFWIKIFALTFGIGVATGTSSWNLNLAPIGQFILGMLAIFLEVH